MNCAFAYARTRVLRAGLLGREDGDRLRSAAGAPAQIAALHALGIDAANAAAVRRAFLARFAADAGKLVRSWPVGRELLLAIAGLEEIENLRLAFRALGAGLPAARWTRLWRPLGPVARLSLDAFSEAPSLRAAVESIARTPYGGVAERVPRAHEADPAAVELAMDRFASQRLVSHARDAPPDARQLALRAVRKTWLAARPP